MTRGKYAARTANRLAQHDNEIISDLRAQIAATTAERDEARQEINRLQSKLATAVDAAAKALAEDRVAEVNAALQLERRARAEDRERIGKEVFAVFHRFGTYPQPAALAELASIFGLADRMGELFNLPNGNRHSKRMTARRARLIQAHIDAGDREVQ